ncbi:MAG: mannose-1-phosphate guanylyltransferase [Planctomycetes bacterium]|nr:mannose-1-phosphate guanylyltransferase [Planctomycetota bacterium]
MLHAVILAGGSGTRFWPRSRKALPKHHLAIAGSRTLLQQTADRLEGEVPYERVLILTVPEQVAETRRQLPGIPAENVVVEPEGRNTAACAGLAAVLVSARDPDPMLLMVTADHVIEPKRDYWQSVRAAVDLAADGSTLVIFGIRPRWGNPGFGYIARGESAGEIHGVRCFCVRKFLEKPSPEKARELAASGDNYWNSGMFVWKASAILGEMQRHAPDVLSPLLAFRAVIGTPRASDVLAAAYAQMPRLPIDKAVMEKSSNVKVVEATFQWDDVGSWKAVCSHHPQDEKGNTVLGSHVGLDTRDCLLASDPDHLIATVGVSGLIIVHTRDATLVCRKEDAERVKELVDRIERSGRKGVL